MMDDLRLAFRSLRRSPGFAAVAILILGLGIGANTALFGALQATVLRTLPYPQPERLVEVATSSLKSGATMIERDEIIGAGTLVALLRAVVTLNREDAG